MHVDVYKMFYGNYKFTVEIDTGSETGANQLTLWFAEKVDVKQVHLSHFSIDVLLEALQEPLRSHLHAQLNHEKLACQKEFEDQLKHFQHSSQASMQMLTKKQSNKVKRQIRQLREQLNNAVQRINAEFIKRELMPLDRLCFDLDRLRAASHVFSEARFLRNFYFEEANKRHIKDFCQKFALDEAFRQDVLAGRTHWAMRDALFVRNLLSILGEDRNCYDRKARKFFHWLDAHCEEILVLPEYQRLQEVDSVLAPNMHELDPEIRQAVDFFNLIPGVTVHFSCQGVSGKVHFQGYDLLTVSSHQEYGFVSFSELGPYAHDAIIAFLPSYPHIRTDPMPYHSVPQPVLRSAGDNIAFRKELLELVRRVVADLETSIHSVWMLDNKVPTSNHQVVKTMEQIYSSSPQARHISRWQDTIYPECCPRTSAPGGIIPSRLDWLCQPEQIERTLHLLFHLNHWAKAREHLWYDDRQGLYKVKAVVLQQAYKRGAICPVAYIDGSETFGCNYFFDMAIDIATETCLERLEMSFDRNNHVIDELDLEARRIFAHIMGYEAKTKADSEALDEERTKSFIGQSLKKLVNQARSTRQPIPSQELAALFISPTDLLEIHLSRDRCFPDWDELEECETRQLDPEGLSLIAFQYNSSNAHYVFHLPFRIAEKFLPEQLIRELQNHTNTSREGGTFYGRAITEAESSKFPVEAILRELLVDISAICPRGLVRKEQQFYSSRGWPTRDWDDEDEDDEAIWYEDWLE